MFVQVFVDAAGKFIEYINVDLFYDIDTFPARDLQKRLLIIIGD
jgi:hypothetical protein